VDRGRDKVRGFMDVEEGRRGGIRNKEVGGELRERQIKSGRGGHGGSRNKGGGERLGWGRVVLEGVRY
jgi:hypothetical protein